MNEINKLPPAADDEGTGLRDLRQVEHEIRTVALVEWPLDGSRRDAVLRWASAIREVLDRPAVALGAASRSAPGWQDIETVPKKGPVLVTNGTLTWIAHHPHMTRAKSPAVTHWMPLPPLQAVIAPPVAREERTKP